jgi:hypothetical protein
MRASDNVCPNPGLVNRIIARASSRQIAAFLGVSSAPRSPQAANESRLESKSIPRAIVDFSTERLRGGSAYGIYNSSACVRASSGAF